MILTLTRLMGAADDRGFTEAAEAAVAALSAQPGCDAVSLARSTDDPTAWCLVVRYADAGALRHVNGGYEVKVALLTLQQWSVPDGGGVFEVLGGDGAGDSVLRPDAIRW